MLKQSTQSDAELVAELSTEEQEHLAGGNSWYGGWGGRRWGGGWGWGGRRWGGGWGWRGRRWGGGWGGWW